MSEYKMNEDHKFQIETAKSLIEEINSDIDELDELDYVFLLDMMGVLGIEFAVGTKASESFIEVLVPGAMQEKK